MLALLGKDLQIIRHILQHILEVIIDPLALIFPSYGFRKVCGHFHEHQAVHLLNRLLDLLLQVSQFEKDLVNLFPQLGLLLSQLLELFLGKPALLYHGFNLINVRGVSIHQGHHLGPLDLPHLDIHKGKALFPHLLIQFLEEAFALCFILLHDLFFSVEIVLTLKKLWDLFLQGLHKIVHVFLKLPPHPCLEPQKNGGFGILEVVHIAEVIRHPLLFI